jgi:hypothetical protein
MCVVIAYGMQGGDVQARGSPLTHQERVQALATLRQLRAMQLESSVTNRRVGPLTHLGCCQVRDQARGLLVACYAGRQCLQPHEPGCQATHSELRFRV